MGRRRRSRPGLDTRAIPVVAVILFVGSAYAIPGEAFAEAGAFALIACALWFVGARRRITELHRWGAVSNLYTLSPEDFERHVAATYAALGYKVSLTKRIGDQGIDVVAERSQERIGIQCKQAITSDGNSDTTVNVHLIATDQNRDGSRRTTTYDGYWKVVADPKGGWLLDGGRFHRA